MKQHYSKYTPEDFEVWKILFDRQVENLKTKAHPMYLGCLSELKDVLNAEAIPNFDELNMELGTKTGWTIEVVPGMIPVAEFFELLSQRKFCSSTWLRKKSQLDYLEEPDMFHDIFGHIPLLMNPAYALFVEKFALLGKKHKGNEKMLNALQRLYWYTIEFGLIKKDNKSEIYGAGIISSYGESNHIFSDNVEILSFDLDWIIDHDFINSEIQTVYVEIASFEELYASIKQLEKQLLSKKVITGL
jgi:phenylalanine-4-hydroxylase